MIKLPLKSQISIFVVIGAVIVLSFILYFALSDNSLPVFEDERASTSVKNFVDSCLDLQTKNGIKKIGASGGWLYSPPLVLTNRELPEIVNRRAKGLNFLEKIPMPYWYFYDDGSDSFSLNIPEYDSDNQYSMKNQLKKYILDTIEDQCIQNLDSFKDIYSIEYNPRNLEIKVEFNEDEIIVEMINPIEVRDNEGNIEFVDTFLIQRKNELYIPYNLARDIVISESKSSFVEKRILNFLSPYQSTSQRDLLPPFYDFRMTYDFRPWKIEDSKKLIKEIINTHISKIQFLNTNHVTNELDPRLRGSQFATNLNNLYTKDYITENTDTRENNTAIFRSYRDYIVRPTYEPFFPSSIEISPSLGNQILLPRPQAVVNLIPFFFTEYTSVYEITMPIVFEIRPDENPDSFVFNVPIEANIDHNAPLSENVDFNIDIESFSANENLKTLICDPTQFISEYIYVNITDKVDYGKIDSTDKFTGVDDAIVSFNCKNIASCHIMNTEINEFNEKGNVTSLKFRLPTNCDPGSIEIYKYGHNKLNFNNIDPRIDKPIFLGEQEMNSEKEIKLDVKLVRKGESRFATGRSIEKNEEGFLIFQNLDDEDVVSFVAFDLENEDNLNVKLMPGKYSVEGFVILNEQVLIESEEVCTEDTCQTLPEMKLDSWIIASVEVDEFEVKLFDVVHSEKLNVKVIEYGVPSNYGSLSGITDTISNINEFSRSFRPYFDLEE